MNKSQSHALLIKNGRVLLPDGSLKNKLSWLEIESSQALGRLAERGWRRNSGCRWRAGAAGTG